MTELNKRIITSTGLFLILLASVFNDILLSSFLLFCYFQMIYEFYFVFSKIFRKKKNYIFVILLLLIPFILYIILFTWTALINDNKTNKQLFFLIITITISSDLGGYIFGKIFKGKKLTKVSPNKTYSGMFGSYVLSLIISIFIFNNFISIDKLIIIVLVISTTSQIGDLLISFLKRKSKLKDTGNLLPGHGGLLDRFDGLILAIPVGSIFALL